jgi:FKBP-type peptidyl-prolyl cis-trans isomerase SlyD
MIPKFEENIAGLKKDDKFNFVIKAAEAYGEVNQEAIVNLDKSIFGENTDVLEVGKTLPMQDKDGNRFDGIILEVSDNNVKMDFNHPLAGVDLSFEGEIVDVRDATPEEISHGHVH